MSGSLRSALRLCETCRRYNCDRPDKCLGGLHHQDTLPAPQPGQEQPPSQGSGGATYRDIVPATRVPKEQPPSQGSLGPVSATTRAWSNAVLSSKAHWSNQTSSHWAEWHRDMRALARAGDPKGLAYQALQKASQSKHLAKLHERAAAGDGKARDILQKMEKKKTPDPETPLDPTLLFGESDFQEYLEILGFLPFQDGLEATSSDVDEVATKSSTTSPLMWNPWSTIRELRESCPEVSESALEEFWTWLCNGALIFHEDYSLGDQGTGSGASRA